MKRILGVSFLTLMLISGLSRAGTIGTVESEIENLQSEIASAQNDLDSARSKAKNASDSNVKAKAAALEEKRAALSKRLREINTRPAPKPVKPEDMKEEADLFTPDKKGERDDSPKGKAPDSPVGDDTSSPKRDEPTKEETVLSGEGIPGEITYQKKAKAAKKIPAKTPPAVVKEEPNEAGEPSTEASPATTGAGTSEIQYPKKKSKK